MFRVAFGAGIALLAGLAVATSAIANDPRSTRIEPRDFYGATVSIEAGVRVFRPLPPATHVIVNPNGTPLSLSFEESRHVYEQNHYRKSGDAGSGAPVNNHAAAASGGFPVGVRNRARRGRGRGAGRFPR